MKTEFISWLQSEASRLALNPSEDAGYALPQTSLKLLKRLVTHSNLKTVFEFGSGRSTEAFLSMGCRLTSLEDSAEWLDQTRAGLVKTDGWKPCIQPLMCRWDHWTPFHSWKLTEELKEELSSAELVLIDSPAHPPSREMALLDTLRSGNQGIVVLDDADIPTLKRFCEAICLRNPSISGAHLKLDHGIYVFDLRNRGGSLKLSRGLLESCKAWRRYFQV